MIELEHQMAVLADLELNYKDSMLEGNWQDFFLHNNVGIPLATLITLGLAEFSKDEQTKFYGQTLIRKSFVSFAEELDIDPQLEYITAQHMFDHSDNAFIIEPGDPDARNEFAHAWIDKINKGSNW